MKSIREENTFNEKINKMYVVAQTAFYDKDEENGSAVIYNAPENGPKDQWRGRRRFLKEGLDGSGELTWTPYARKAKRFDTFTRDEIFEQIKSIIGQKELLAHDTRVVDIDRVGPEGWYDKVWFDRVAEMQEEECGLFDQIGFYLQYYWTNDKEKYKELVDKFNGFVDSQKHKLDVVEERNLSTK